MMILQQKSIIALAQLSQLKMVEKPAIVLQPNFHLAYLFWEIYCSKYRKTWNVPFFSCFWKVSFVFSRLSGFPDP